MGNITGKVYVIGSIETSTIQFLADSAVEAITTNTDGTYTLITGDGSYITRDIKVLNTNTDPGFLIAAIAEDDPKFIDPSSGSYGHAGESATIHVFDGATEIGTISRTLQSEPIYNASTGKVTAIIYDPLNNYENIQWDFNTNHWALKI